MKRHCLRKGVAALNRLNEAQSIACIFIIIKPIPSLPAVRIAGATDRGCLCFPEMSSQWLWSGARCGGGVNKDVGRSRGREKGAIHKRLMLILTLSIKSVTKTCNIKSTQPPPIEETPSMWMSKEEKGIDGPFVL